MRHSFIYGIIAYLTITQGAQAALEPSEGAPGNRSEAAQATQGPPSPGPTNAEEPITPPHSSLRPAVRPHGAVELGFGFLTLPGAEVCVDVEQGCKTGDTSLELHAWQIYRASPAWAFGAGLTLALTPSTDAPRRDPPGIPRDHERRYFTIEATVRHYPVVKESFEAWLGLAGGLVILSDRFAPQDPGNDKALIGPPGLSIRTEGVSVGLGGGAVFALTQNWSVSTALQISNWFLPETPEVNALGDEASLSGRMTMFDLRFSFAYRFSL